MSSSSAAGDEPPSPWDALPPHLQERILRLLPVSLLVRLLPVSRALLALLRSPIFLRPPVSHRLDAFFLLSPSLAYQPLSSRLRGLPLRLPPTPPLLSSPSLLISPHPHPHPHPHQLSSSHPFSHSPPLRLPPLPPSSYLLAIFPLSPRRFALLAVDAAGGSYLLDSGGPSPRWDRRGELPLRFAVLGNAVGPLGAGLIFVLGRGPDALLGFDPATEHWRVLRAALPRGLAAAHLFAFAGRLFLVGGVETLGLVERVVVWGMEEVDGEGVGWMEVSVMPGEVFEELVGGRPGRFWHFQVADRMGIVCLYNAADGRLVMFDAAEGAWTRLTRVSGVGSEESRRWFGHVVEPDVELLLGWHRQC